MVQLAYVRKARSGVGLSLPLQVVDDGLDKLVVSSIQRDVGYLFVVKDRRDK